MDLVADLKPNKFLCDEANDTCYSIAKIKPGSGYIYLVSFRRNEKDITLPEKYCLAEITRKREAGVLVLHDSNPYLSQKDFSRLSIAQGKGIEVKWKKVKQIVADDEFFDGKRFAVIEAVAAQEPKMATNTILTSVRKYYYGGMCKAALASNFQNCGAPGRSKSTRKITQALVDLICLGFYKYFLNADLHMEDARLRTIEREWDEKIHGTTFFDYSTFRRYGKKHFPNEFENKVRKRGRKNAKRDNKLNRGTTNSIAIGPASIFQIDWHKSNIHLVAGFNRSVNIGTPYIYCVVDSFSRLLVGVLITMERPCWKTFMHAIYYAAMDKATLASFYEYDLGGRVWLGSCLPESIIADGEGANLKANSLGQNLGITLAVVESYRGDLKGVVERMHKTMRDRIDLHFDEAGLIVDPYGRRLRVDAKKEACATLQELYQIAFEFALEYNSGILDKHPHNAQLLEYLVDKTPDAIWQWGTEQGFGFQKSERQKNLFLELLERDDLVPSSNGFCIDKNFFIPIDTKDQVLLENLINRPNGAGKMSVIYDPSCFANKFWLYDDRLIPLKNLGQDVYEFTSLWEMQAANEYYYQRKQASQQDLDKRRIAMNVAIGKIVENAQAMQSGARPKADELSNAKAIQIELEKSRVFQMIKTNESTTEDAKRDVCNPNIKMDDISAADLEALNLIDLEIRAVIKK